MAAGTRAEQLFADGPRRVLALDGGGVRGALMLGCLAEIEVGTGHGGLCLPTDEVMDMTAVALAAQSMMSIMEDANWLGQTILQWMSDSPTSWQIDTKSVTCRGIRWAAGRR